MRVIDPSLGKVPEGRKGSNPRRQIEGRLTSASLAELEAWGDLEEIRYAIACWGQTV